jgi:hypothetical protein
VDSRKSAAGHVMPNLASGAICGSRSALWGIRGTKRRRTIFHARVGPVRMPQNAYRDTLRQTYVFASDVICGSRSALGCIQGAKHHRNIFDARVGPVRVP